MKVSFTKSKDPENENGMKVEYAPSKRKVSKAVWWTILTIVFAPFVWLFVTMCMKWLFITSSGVVTMASYPVTSVQHGTIEKICVKPGQKVKAGTVLFEIKPSLTQDYYDELGRARAELGALGYGCGSVSRTYTGGTSVPANYMSGQIAFLQKEERAYRSLIKNGAATRAEYNEAKQRLLNAQEGRRAALAAAAGKTTTTVDTSGISRRAYLTNYVKMLESRGTQTIKIRAPKDGVVENITVTPGYDAVGDYELLRISDPAQPFFIAYVFPENYDKRVSPGNEVTVKMPGSKRKIKAVVVERPTNANNIPGGLSNSILAGRRSIIVFLKPEEKLLPEELVNGMPVEIDWGIRLLR
jgi:multidrug resistance efflux pump